MINSKRKFQNEVIFRGNTENVFMDESYYEKKDDQPENSDEDEDLQSLTQKSQNISQEITLVRKYQSWIILLLLLTLYSLANYFGFP